MDRELVGWNRQLHPEVPRMPGINCTEGWVETRLQRKAQEWEPQHREGAPVKSRAP